MSDVCRSRGVFFTFTDARLFPPPISGTVSRQKKTTAQAAPTYPEGLVVLVFILFCVSLTDLLKGICETLMCDFAF